MAGELKEKWVCGRYCSGPFQVKQVFVRETEHQLKVESIQDAQTPSILGHKKTFRKDNSNVLFNTATEAIQRQIDDHELAIHNYHEKIKQLTAELRQLDVLKVPR